MHVDIHRVRKKRCHLSTTVLQGSVATRVNYDKIFNDLFIAKFTAECDGKRILKIG